MHLSQASIFEECSIHCYIFYIYLKPYGMESPFSLFDSYLTQAAAILNISGS